MSLVAEADCLRRVMVLMMAADEVVDDDEIAAIIRLFKEATGKDVSAEELRAEAEALPEGMRLGECAGRLAGNLDQESRMKVLSAVFDVAAADGFVVQEEDHLLSRLARDLEIPKDEYDAAIKRFLAR